MKCLSKDAWVSSRAAATAAARGDPALAPFRRREHERYRNDVTPLVLNFLFLFFFFALHGSARILKMYCDKAAGLCVRQGAVGHFTSLITLAKERYVGLDLDHSRRMLAIKYLAQHAQPEKGANCSMPTVWLLLRTVLF